MRQVKLLSKSQTSQSGRKQFFKWPLLSSFREMVVPTQEAEAVVLQWALTKTGLQDQHRAVTMQEEVCSRRGMVKTNDQP